ncbi:MAG: tRNA pseudouridine(38-40) synthase TruA [Leptospirales bacterium]|nr:tRNA pseudouridine(38-40) synthase TruA [Leptospirales bacterium]
MEQTACSGIAGRKRRIALLLQYDGTAFNGWQLQGSGRTVQGELEKAITVLTGEMLRVTASGRTDSGVHALGQVAHFDTAGGHSLDRLCIGLNGIMGADISVRNAYETDALFHSRFSALEREYLYLIYNYPQRNPFMRYRAMWLNRKLDESYLADTLRYIEGEHDFASFCKKKSRLENTVRKILQTDVKRRGDYIFISIRGNAFLHNMVRIIVGTCVYMFMNNEAPSRVLEILNGKNRDLSGSTAPPYGLYLKEIKFSPELAAYPSAFAG